MITVLIIAAAAIAGAVVGAFVGILYMVDKIQRGFDKWWR